MKILLIHYAYFITGGPEKYLFNVKKTLEEKNHCVIPFSMCNKKNHFTKYAKYFATPINNDDNWYFSKKSKWKSHLKQFIRLFYSSEVEYKLSKLIISEKPDIAYVLLYQKKLSPAVLVACKKQNLPIINRISDYQQMCPKYTFYRDGNICEECKKTKLYSIKYRCIKNSYFFSSIWYFALLYQKLKKFNGLVDCYVLTNPFMEKKFKEYGNETKCRVIETCTAKNEHFIKPYPLKIKKQQICYVGNIFEHKGIDLLLSSFSLLIKSKPNLKLVIVGDDSDNIIKNEVRCNFLDKNIDYLGHSNERKVIDVLSESLYSILPAKWYENLPNTIIESFSVGTPVVCSNIGSLKYIIKNHETGFLFEYNNIFCLTEVLKKALNITEKEYIKMKHNCLNEIKQKYSFNLHYRSLIQLFQEYIDSKNND